MYFCWAIYIPLNILQDLAKLSAFCCSDESQATIEISKLYLEKSAHKEIMISFYTCLTFFHLSMLYESVQYTNHVWFNVSGWQGVVVGWSF